MAIVKRHWKMFLLSSILSMTVLVGGVVWLNMGVSNAIAEDVSEVKAPSSDPVLLSAEDYSQIRQLREGLFLGNEDLAAIGCSSAQAETVFSGLRDWYLINKASWLEAQRKEAMAQWNLLQVFKKTGVSDWQLGRELSQCKADLLEAKQQKKNLLEDIQRRVNLLFSSPQQTHRELAMQNHGLPTPYRYLPTSVNTPESASNLRHRIMQKRQSEAVEGRLSAVESAELTTLKTQINTCMPMILAGEERQLPIPEGIRMPEERPEI